MCGVMGDNELFDYFLDFNLVAQALADVPAKFPFPADYPTTVVPAVQAALGSPYPSVLNAQGIKLRGVTQNISGGERPAFATSFITWGNFLFTVGPAVTSAWLLATCRTTSAPSTRSIPTPRYRPTRSR